MNKSLVCVAALFVAVGCNKEKPSDAPAASATAAASASAAPVATVDPVASAAPAATDSAPAATAAAAPVAPAVVAKIPTEEDYEATASSAITAANASAQLSSIEKEIAAP